MYQKIIQFLKDNDIYYKEIGHDSVYTSQQASLVRGLTAHQGAKSLLLKADETFIMAIIPGDARLDSKKLRAIAGQKHLRFATPEEVEKVMKCKIGSCYPFGNLINIPMYIDRGLGDNKMIAFSPAEHTKSILINWSDYIKIISAKFADITV